MLILLIIGTTELYATTYYVSTTGSDTNVGTFVAPFATIQHGSNQLLPGDSLIVRGGIYFEKIYLNTSGAVNNPIVISSYDNETAIIDGTGVTGLENAHHISTRLCPDQWADLPK